MGRTCPLTFRSLRLGPISRSQLLLHLLWLSVTGRYASSLSSLSTREERRSRVFACSRATRLCCPWRLLHSVRHVASFPVWLFTHRRFRYSGSPDSPNTPLVPLSTKNDLSAERPTDLQLPDDTLAPGDKLTLSIICHGTSLGAHEALLLFVYHSSVRSIQALIVIFLS